MRLAAFVALMIVSGCGQRVPGQASVLLFAGNGTSPNDVRAIEALLQNGHIDYSVADSGQLVVMPEADLRRYRLLIMPGGNFIQIGEGLTTAATRKVRDAVIGGMNYLGICAGAFLAGNSGPNPVKLLTDIRFGFYGAEKQGIRKAPVWIDGADGSRLEQYWEDGPELSGWGAVAAKYPDGKPAVVEGAVGRGWVVLTGFHPEAPENWRVNMAFRTSAGEDNAYALKLIRAALLREVLPHY